MSEIQSKENVEITKPQSSEVEELKSEEVRQVVNQVIEEYEFRGPIPPPNIIAGYEKILPGSADRILAMAEKQSNHRHNMEAKMINAESRDSLLGVIFAFVLGFGCIIAAIVMVIVVPKGAGAICGSLIGVTGIGSIIATFIKSTRSNYGRSNTNNTES